MSKSRRGLLAAGLAVAVVGAVGVASTRNAGAEQILVDVALGEAAAAPVAVPPTVLPWGGRPEEISTGKAGASSTALYAAGLDAAANDTGGSTRPRGRYAPKGRTAKGGVLDSEVTDIAPPEPAGSTSTARTRAPAAVAPAPTASGPSDTTVNYLYNVGSQTAETDGFYTNVTIGKPALDDADYHTLAELAVQSADGKQIVEVGWNVDRVVNGDDDPHLFVYHWVNRETSCYNGCGFQQYSSTIKPGDTLASGVTKKFGIQYSNGAWWSAFNSEWVGYFPETLWTDKGVSFNRSGMIQVFGEVAATSTDPCTDMGNGLSSANTSAALLGSVSYLNGPTVALTIRSTTDVYSVAALSARTFRYGGPGAC